MIANKVLKSSKINEFRLWGLVLTLTGMGIMILGTAGMLLWEGNTGRMVLTVAMVLGLLIMLGSITIYFWAGILSTSAVSLQCPECGKQTKILGKTDRCMFCKTILTLDPQYANEANENNHPH